MKFSRRLISIIMILGIGGCNTAQATQSVPLQATRTAPLTPTVLPATATATETEQPQVTPSMQPPLPTLTPAVRAGSASAYHLAAQTADQADETITRMEQAILGLQDAPPPAPDLPGWMPNYAPYYRAAWYATWNALARFPNDPRADKWHWKMAYYMALAGDGDDAARIYMEQITAALNSGRVDAGDLANWFQSGHLEKTIYTPIFTLDQQPVVLPNIPSGYLIMIGKLNNINTPGGMCMLVIKNAGKYAAYPVYNGFSPHGYSNVEIRNPVTCSLKDVTDDGVDEIIADQYTGGHYGMDTIHIYDVTSQPPRIMPFTASKNEDLQIWNGGIIDYPKLNNKTQLLIQAPVGILDCDNYYIRSYEWNSTWFALSSQEMHFGNPSTPDAAVLCIDTTLSDLDSLSASDAEKFLDQVIQGYQPYRDQLGDLYNELILRKAGHEILMRSSDQPRATLNAFIQSPGLSNSIWIGPAQESLNFSNQTDGRYLACTALTACAPYRGQPDATGQNTCTQTYLCDADSALDSLINTEFSSVPLDELSAKLKNAGVVIQAEGRVDFDKNGQDELWFTVHNNQLDSNELWIAAATPGKGIVAFNAGGYEPDIARPGFSLRAIQAGGWAVDFGGERPFELTHEPSTGQPLFDLINSPDPTQPTDAETQAVKSDLAKFIQARMELYNGNDPNSVYSQMMEIDRKYANCPFEIAQSDGSTLSYYDCGAFYYTLAFAAELAGKDDEAVKRYYGVWSVYPDSPFALLAREKLYK